MDTLDENEVDIGEVQVGLCDNMIRTTSAIWESYDSYDSKDDTFTWELVEMNNESFNIPQQRDASTKDCKGKAKVHYSSYSRKLKTKRSDWSEESSTNGNNQIYPLAFGVVDRETDDSIQWFLEKLKGATGEVPNLGFMTDQKTYFSKGISSVFLSAFHDLSVQHLSQYLHDKYKNDTIATLFYNVSRTYRESMFLAAWRNILAFPNESMSSILKEPRDLPIASFLEHVRDLLQRWFWKHREEGIKVTSTLTKWAEFVLQKKQERALTMKVALAVFIEIVMVEKDKKTQFDMDILGRIDDEEVFKSFDWSTFFYTRLLNSLKTSLQGKKEAYELKKTKSSKAVTYYNIKGYVLAFQAWAYEVLSTSSEYLVTRNSEELIPRITPSYKML
ncbi:MuDRA-like transposase [Cucumis melo var. makuwa]|uniref:MuDRA-like transposase n=1 Tax=Cucumis melo var. makuwa TaxID=1194695 RepID=A0A5A7SPU8_CUCMM|nr:MuDRA-like transposase [Cucumis melo var. makuwa]